MLTGLGPEQNAGAGQRAIRADPGGADDLRASSEAARRPQSRRHHHGHEQDGLHERRRTASPTRTRGSTSASSARRGASRIETGPACIRALEAHHAPRFLAFFHFTDPDSAGHGFGIDSGEYRKAAADEDRWLGRIVAWLKENKLDASTLIYVTADHGFNPHAFFHTNAPHIWLATNDKRVTRGGIQADVPATILAFFGVDLSKLQPKLVGSDLAQPAKPAAKQLQPAGAGR